MANIQRVKPEVMSPAGYWPQLRAAIEAGADAVYFGLQHFTARAKVGFTLAELPEVMRTLHARGVKGYVTFNTLVFEHELREAAKTLAAIAETGADSIIVQDLAIAKLAREIAPSLAVHGSTQMSITSAEGVELARSLGVSRVVLARELSLEEIRAIRESTDLELEMFVHGALCVSYSGQCFSSEAWGGRSANRGQCAQACRLSYDLMVDDRPQPLGDARYLLSPGDLYALHEIPEIIECGVSALKIEGRYKDEDYVALATDAYRKAIDAAWEHRTAEIAKADELRLEQAYSRGFGPYFVSGTNHQAVVKGRAPRHRGTLMGRVTEILRNAVRIAPNADAQTVAPLKPGDGVVFDAADWRSPNEKEEGGHVFAVRPRGKSSLEIEFGNEAVDFARIRVGDLLWRTHDPELARAVKPLLEALRRKQSVEVAVEARTGSKLIATWRLGGHSVTVDSAGVLEPAQNQGLTIEKLREQFERLGNTPYALGSLQAAIEGNPFVPASLLNQLRRDAVEKLVALQTADPRVDHRDPVQVIDAAIAAARRPDEPEIPGSAQMHLLVRTPEQLDAALALRPASITLDYLELYGLQPSVEKIKTAGIVARVASPRVLKPAEQRIVHFLLKLDCLILVRSGGLLHALRQFDNRPAELIGDFSLNAANAISAAILMDLGLTRFTPTHDLNADQIARVARDAGPQHIEAIAYQHLPVFHTEHCVFCRFLSTGTSFKDCGHPCEKHKVALRDQQGREHPVMADVGCRNTVFGAEAQEASLHLDRWRAAGIRHFRLEFVHETGAQVTKICEAFRDALDNRITSRELSQRWKRISPQGVTEGSLFVPANYMTLPVLQ
jgi:putative protease